MCVKFVFYRAFLSLYIRMTNFFFHCRLCPSCDNSITFVIFDFNFDKLTPISKKVFSLENIRKHCDTSCSCGTIFVDRNIAENISCETKIGKTLHKILKNMFLREEIKFGWRVGSCAYFDF